MEKRWSMRGRGSWEKGEGEGNDEGRVPLQWNMSIAETGS